MANISLIVTKYKVITKTNDLASVQGAAARIIPHNQALVEFNEDKTKIIIYSSNNAPSIISNIEAIDTINGVEPSSLENLIDLLADAMAAKGTVSTSTTPTGLGTSTSLLSKLLYRTAFFIRNIGPGNCYIKFGTEASTSDYNVKLAVGEIHFNDKYSGDVECVWDGILTCSAKVTDITF